MAVPYITYEDDDYKGYEIYELKDGTGEICIQGGVEEAGVLFQGKPIALHVGDFAGSVAQYLARGSYYYEYKSIVNEIRSLVNDEFDREIPLSQSLNALLKLFESGQFLLGQYELKDYDYFTYDESKVEFYEHYYLSSFTTLWLPSFISTSDRQTTIK